MKRTRLVDGFHNTNMSVRGELRQRDLRKQYVMKNKEKEMNKRIFALFLAMGMMAGSQAFASRARLLVMGTGDAGNILVGNGNGGSLYVDDAYNMFYNPAYINEYKDWGIIEKSNYAGAAGGGTTAQGGFVASIMNFNVGVYMNRVGADPIWTTPGNTRPIDVIFGGDAGMLKYGIGVTWGYNKQQAGTNQNLTVNAGVTVDGFEPFGGIRIIGKEQQINGANPPKHRMYQLGMRYHWGEWVPYAAWNWTRNSDAVTNNAFMLGFGRNTKVAEGVKLNYGLGVARNAAQGVPTAIAYNGGHSNAWQTPINVSVEGEVASWITARGGVAYNLIDTRNGFSVATDSTTAAVGFTFHWSKLSLDWALGHDGAGSGANVETAGVTNAQHFDLAHSFFTAASLQYNW